MTITAYDIGVATLVVFLVFATIYSIIRIIWSEAVRSRDRIIRDAEQEAVNAGAREKEAIDRLRAAQKELSDLNGKVDRVAEILGFAEEDEDDKEDEKPEVKPEPPAPKPTRSLYACSVIALDDDGDYDGAHCCLQIKASSKDEARGVVARVAGNRYERYEIEWAEPVLEPEIS